MGWGFNAGVFRLLMLSSEFLVALTVGMGAQIENADLEVVARACPHLQRLTLRFATVSGEGRRPPPYFMVMLAGFILGYKHEVGCQKKCMHAEEIL